MCHISGVTCHVAGGRCHVSCVTFLLFLLDKEVELVGGGSVINGSTPSSYYEATYFLKKPGCFLLGQK